MNTAPKNAIQKTCQGNPGRDERSDAHEREEVVHAEDDHADDDEAAAGDGAQSSPTTLPVTCIGHEEAGEGSAWAESVKTYEGTHDIHTPILGQSLTGIGAY
jgi:hypothetical protein